MPGLFSWGRNAKKSAGASSADATPEPNPFDAAFNGTLAIVCNAAFLNSKGESIKNIRLQDGHAPLSADVALFLDPAQTEQASQWQKSHVDVRKVSGEDVPEHEHALIGQLGVFATQPIEKGSAIGAFSGFVIGNANEAQAYHQSARYHGKTADTYSVYAGEATEAAKALNELPFVECHGKGVVSIGGAGLVSRINSAFHMQYGKDDAKHNVDIGGERVGLIVDEKPL